jgi:hypothetical protein
LITELAQPSIHPQASQNPIKIFSLSRHVPNVCRTPISPFPSNISLQRLKIEREKQQKIPFQLLRSNKTRELFRRNENNSSQIFTLSSDEVEVLHSAEVMKDRWREAMQLRREKFRDVLVSRRLIISPFELPFSLCPSDIP